MHRSTLAIALGTAITLAFAFLPGWLGLGDVVEGWLILPVLVFAYVLYAATMFASFCFVDWVYDRAAVKLEGDDAQG